MRVHELAGELGVASKDILAALEEMGLEGRTALSSVPEEAVPRLRASGGRPVPAPTPRTPLFRTRQDRVMAAAALLLFAGSFSTFAILGSDPARPVSRVFPDVVLPVSQPQASPAGGDLATREAPPAAEPSPSPRPRLGLARGAGVAPAGEEATSPPPSSPALAAAPRSTTQAPPATVRPSPPAPTTEPPEPSHSPTESPEPSPSPTESPSPSPSPSPSDDDD